MKGTHAGEPTHVVRAYPYDRSLCGIKDPLPSVAEKAVQAHVDGWGMVVCSECAEVMGRPVLTQESLF